MHKIYFLFSIFLLLFIHQFTYAQQAEQNITFKKFNAKAYSIENSKELIYTEKHEVEYVNNIVEKSKTIYVDKDGKIIAEMITDYSKNIKIPTYVFRDFKNMTEEGLKFVNNEYVIFSKNKDKEETKTISATENIFSCQGWHYYIVNSLEKLKTEELLLDLIIPLKLDSYTFKLKFMKIENDNLKFRLELKNWLIRIFAPHLDIVYNPQKKTLVSYVGPSNILNSEGKIQTVKILYDDY